MTETGREWDKSRRDKVKCWESGKMDVILFVVVVFLTCMMAGVCCPLPCP